HGARGVDPVPRLLCDLPRARGLTAVRGARLGAARLFPLLGLPHRPGRGHRAARVDHGRPGAQRQLRATREDRPLDAPALALRLRDGRARLLDALPPLSGAGLTRTYAGLKFRDSSLAPPRPSPRP